jgi:DNA-directed RNA polymerase subunit beta'
LTDGSADIDEIFEYGGEERAKDYVITEVGKIYELQGETVSRKHIELIVKQMFSRRKIIDGGDTNFTEGMIIDDIQFAEENAEAKEAGGTIAKAEKLVMGITETSLSRKSFLSAASFQHTTRVLIANAVRGASDDLTGLMENVIIGRLVPAGSGFVGSPKKKMIDAVSAGSEEVEGE